MIKKILQINYFFDQSDWYFILFPWHSVLFLITYKIFIFKKFHIVHSSYIGGGGQWTLVGWWAFKVMLTPMLIGFE